jgi:hypothetical protein
MNAGELIARVKAEQADSTTALFGDPACALFGGPNSRNAAQPIPLINGAHRARHRSH